MRNYFYLITEIYCIKIDSICSDIYFPILPGGHFSGPSQPEFLPVTLTCHDGPGNSGAFIRSRNRNYLTASAAVDLRVLLQ